MKQLYVDDIHMFDIFVYFRKDNVLRLWDGLIDQLKVKHIHMEHALGLQKIFKEMLIINDWMDKIKVFLAGMIIIWIFLGAFAYEICSSKSPGACKSKQSLDKR